MSDNIIKFPNQDENESDEYILINNVPPTIPIPIKSIWELYREGHHKEMFKDSGENVFVSIPKLEKLVRQRLNYAVDHGREWPIRRSILDKHIFTNRELNNMRYVKLKYPKGEE